MTATLMPMKISNASKLFLSVALGFAGVGSTIAQDTAAASKRSINLPVSKNGATCGPGSGARIFVEIDQSGKIWLNWKPIDDLLAIDDIPSSLPNYDGTRRLKLIFRCDHLASAKSFVTIVSRLEKQTEPFDVILAVKVEDSDREFHIGADLLQDKANSKDNKVKTPDPVDGSASSSNADESTSSEEIESGPEILRVAVNADGSFTTDGKDFDKVGFLDHWRMVGTIAKMLDEELHVYAEFDPKCTFQHVVNLLDPAAWDHSRAKFKFSLAKPTAGEK